MDFFEHQDVARKKTGRLVVLFLLAVVAITVALYVTFVIAIGFLLKDPETGALAISWANPVAAVLAVLAVVCVVGGGTGYKLLQLRAGGQVVARHLGGRLLQRDTADRQERGLLNIVEEMAIASGTPVPPVYMMDGERGINAFAAGYAPESAVIGVTRGALEQLTRAEMQGVIAHEFSHILNGDMRLNIRLMGVIHGILLLGIIGTLIIRTFFYGAVLSGGRGGGDRKGGGGQAAIVIVAVAAVFIVLGAVGTFFGTWIKSAVSRQREFLADASAVQFTRDPDTIAGALKAIGGFKHRARIMSPHAPEASHMFFGQAITSGFNNIFATHPPLEERIKRIDRSFDGTIEQRGPMAYPEVRGGDPDHGRPGFGRQRGERLEPEDRSSLERLHDILPVGVPGNSPDEALSHREGVQRVVKEAVIASALASVGTIDEAHVEHARSLLRSIPGPIREATGDAFSARAVVFGLLLHREGPDRAKQLEHLKANADAAVVRALAKILPSYDGLPIELRLPILDIAAPALAGMTRDQAVTFLNNARALAEADDRLELFEWSLFRIMERRLADAMGLVRRPRVDYYVLHKLTGELSVLLSVVARAGQANPEQQRSAFDAGKGLLQVGNVELLGPPDAGLDALDDALSKLERTAPRLKKRVLAACARCIAADRTVTPHEAELFRVIADELGVPTPPLMPGQPLL